MKPEQLNSLRDKALAEMNAPVKNGGYRVVVGMATCGIAAGAKPVYDALVKGTEGLPNVTVKMTGCIGVCRLEPMVEVYNPDGTKTTYVQMDVTRAEKIAERHLKNGRVTRHYTVGSGPDVDSDDTITSLDDIEFFKRQTRLALRNCGVIDPENIEEYIARDGYQALSKALFEYKPADIIDEMKKSGLRGRGGGGFPTGLKWEFAYKQNPTNGIKYVACNADEGDPGAFMDRSVLEGDPHAVIEAMAIAGYAIGAQMGYIYVRAEYPVAVKRLKIAIEQAKKLGLLGDKIFGTDFNFDLEIRLGAGAFVCGEETALIRSIEGNRGEPRPRPPFPAVSGIFGAPTILNNVETYANVAQIILKGSSWFAGIGSEKSKGTKVFAIGGKINNTGLVEVPMGIPLREVIYDIGGGIPNGKRFKAAQTGGPSGGCIPASLLDTPVEFDTLVAIGSMMGSGGLIVMDEDNCMVDIAKFFLDFTVDESCGKCPPCRIGTKRMLEILEKITAGKGESGDIERLERLAATIKTSALCGLGQTAPNPVLSTLRYFRDEYEAHVNEHKCPSGTCKAMKRITIIPERCKGCGACARVCPVGAISGEPRKPYVVDQSLCIKCGACVERCKFGAIAH